MKANKYSGYCPAFTKTGKCSRGPSCKYAKHDKNHVALCKFYLKDSCSRSPCFMSHNSTPYNAPTCSYFLAGKCSKENCKFSHIKPLEPVKVCPAFASVGYCDEGGMCGKLHSSDCPEYFENGKCGRPNCRLKHRERPVEKQLNVPTGEHTIVNTAELMQNMFGDSDLSDMEEEYSPSSSDNEKDSKTEDFEKDSQSNNKIDLNNDFIKL